MISFKDFKKMEMKVGTIKKVEEIPNSKNLIKLKVDIGGTVKQAVAGIKTHYKSSELEGKQFVFLTNLEPAKLMGETSEIMILAAVEGERVVLLKPEKEISNGAIVE
jgi:methionine--tRNA ligase beta chain